MVPHQLVIDPFNILDRMDCPVVLILRMFRAVFLIAVDAVENLVEVLLSVSAVPQKLRVTHSIFIVTPPFYGILLTFRFLYYKVIFLTFGVSTIRSTRKATLP